MKLPRDKQRDIVWEAIFRHDGDQNAAAEALGIHRRTLQNHVAELGLSESIKAMGWSKPPGRAHGYKPAPKIAGIIQDRIIEHIRKGGGQVNYGTLAFDVYGIDNLASRERIYKVFETMKETSMLSYDRDASLWRVLDKTATG